ncbi:hypothetical protein BV20DRAFT_237909 [Pilatotrama ljubarskyi]|nr:hypothetical protein BV20DRAFT_237909 [Pilatotrama ljubarskyi]
MSFLRLDSHETAPSHESIVISIAMTWTLGLRSTVRGPPIYTGASPRPSAISLINPLSAAISITPGGRETVMSIPSDHSNEERRQGLSIVFTLIPPIVPGSAMERYEWDVMRGKIKRDAAPQSKDDQEGSSIDPSFNPDEDASTEAASPPDSEGSQSEPESDWPSDTVVGEVRTVNVMKWRVIW